VVPKLAVGSLILLGVALIHAPQPTLLLRQDRDGSPAINLTAAEVGSLKDPFFELVLTRTPHPIRLDEIETAIQPDNARPQTFVADENITTARAASSAGPC